MLCNTAQASTLVLVVGAGGSHAGLAYTLSTQLALQITRSGNGSSGWTVLRIMVHDLPASCWALYDVGNGINHRGRFFPMLSSSAALNSALATNASLRLRSYFLAFAVDDIHSRALYRKVCPTCTVDVKLLNGHPIAKNFPRCLGGVEEPR